MKGIPVRGAASFVLAALLLATLVGAATFDRRSWPGLVGDEATYLMAAASLAWDQDLRYERADYDRFFARWGARVFKGRVPLLDAPATDLVADLKQWRSP